MLFEKVLVAVVVVFMPNPVIVCVYSSFCLYCSTPSVMKPTALCTGHVLEGCGSIDAGIYAKFLETVVKLQVKRVQEIKKANKDVPQTPAFMLAVVTDALVECASGRDCVQPTPARGGYSDVGCLAGSLPRDTCWPMVREVFEVGLRGFVSFTGNYMCWVCSIPRTMHAHATLNVERT